MNKNIKPKSVCINKQRYDYLVKVEELACYTFFGVRGTRAKSKTELKKLLDNAARRQHEAEEELANMIVGYDGQRPVTFFEALDGYDFKDNKPGYKYTKKPSKKPAKSTYKHSSP